MNRSAPSESALKLVIHGVPEQTEKIMRLFFRQISKEFIVSETIDDADIHLVDLDYSGSYNILSKLQRNQNQCVFIVASLTERRLDSNIIFLKKPLTKEATLLALKQSQVLLEKGTTTDQKDTNEKSAANDSGSTNKTDPLKKTEQPTAEQKPDKPVNEKFFSNYIGLISGVDFSDPEQVTQASFSPKNYFFCYVYNAIKPAHKKGMVLEINAGWKPLIIFPHSKEIWLDATDHQLRAFANLKMSPSSETNISFSAVNIRELPTNRQDEKFQSEDSLLWKLALWTSKGRYPTNMDPNKPIILKHWPNLTRLIVTPHALRICALLIKQPQSMLDVAKTLNIDPQYVFAFITACSSLNLIAQVDSPPVQKKSENKKTNSLLTGC